MNNKLTDEQIEVNRLLSFYTNKIFRMYETDEVFNILKTIYDLGKKIGYADAVDGMKQYLDK